MAEVFVVGPPRSVTCPRCRRNVLVAVDGRLFRHRTGVGRGLPHCELSHADVDNVLAIWRRTPMVDHSAYDPTDIKASHTYCPACQQVVRCGHLGYVGAFAFHRHYHDPYAYGLPRREREHCINSGWPVADAFFARDDGRIVSRKDYERGWAVGDPGHPWGEVLT